MNNKKPTPKEIPMWAQIGHAKPVTRREMLATGVIPFAAYLTMPAWIQMFQMPEATAADLSTCAPAASGLSPFITVNLAGGASLGGNYIPTKEDGSFLKNYSLLGMGAAATLPVAREFGNVPFGGLVNGRLTSQFLAGVRAQAPTAIAKTAFIAICTRARDDSGSNPLSIDGMLYAAGLRGNLIPNIGQKKTPSGSNQSSALFAPPTPLNVTNVGSITGALAYTSGLAKVLDVGQRGKLAKAVRALSEAQTRRLASLDGGVAVKTMIDCAGIRNEDLATRGVDLVDPRKDGLSGAKLSSIWNLTANSAMNDDGFVRGSIAYNAIKGQSGSASLVLGGYDYHTGNRTSGDAKDLAAGETVGRILETAAAMNSPVTVYVNTDGSCVSVNSSTPDSAWTSDRGTACVAYMLMFDPKGRPATSGHQIGAFTDGQAVEESVVGSRNEAAVAAILANYLKLNGKLDKFDAIAGKLLTASDLSAVLKVG